MSRAVLPLAVAADVYAAAARITALGNGFPHSADARSDRLPAWRQREHVAACSLLRKILSQTAGRAAAAGPLAAHPGGQPYLPGRSDLTVSLSHAGGWVAAAVHTGGGSVGIDVAPPWPVSDAFIRRCCSPSGRAALTRLPAHARDAEAAWIWSVQEACVKATGQGLAGLPWTVAVEPGQRSGRWRHLLWRQLRPAFTVPVSCAYGPPSGDQA
jgi:4'-phosphopantetheinyl transferase